ncbi:phosphoglycolate phosphatase [Marinospirillum celere]|uniref:Phosphoglycolate phosphatase n=1 Tax=Marinospirillum celere TaxID=1122252 RepID=A0A1I1EIL8_9GAMM|nr:HAD-IA family hydrolase [Marinospirillum celere]SFB86452.1 phosphoglycolate phosphatase [Marinospirillum celere]
MQTLAEQKEPPSYNASAEQSIQAVLFDLDGTLVDTAPDLALALNRLREENGLEQLPFEKIRDQVSNGGNALIQLGFNVKVGDPDHPSLRQRLLDLYQEKVAEHSRVFEGLEKLLERLEKQPLPWGIVTNKPRIYTDLLVKALKLHPQVVVCPEDLGVSKPDPAPLLFAARQLAIPPENCLYVGDHARDIEAGVNARMQTLVAGFGYIGLNENPAHWGADFIATSVTELNSWIDRRLDS